MHAMDWSLRPASPDDREFLVAVYKSARSTELASTGWPASEQDAFLRSQFAAQAAHYGRFFPRHTTDIIRIGGQDAGRLIVDRSSGPDLHLMDITLLPQVQGRGIGTQVVRSLLNEAAAAGRGVQLHVEFNNPAMALYTRLGFTEVEDFGLHRRMRWQTSALARAA